MTTSESEDNHLREVLNQALDAIEAGQRQHICRRCQQTSNTVIWHYDRDLEKLNACCPGFEITTEEDYWGIIIDCLETALEDPAAHYKQPQEHICDHSEAYGLEMFAFVVKLKDFTREIYTKFCLKKLIDGTWYVSIDCHT